MFSILHRMILWELLKIFLLSLVALTGLVLLAGIVAEASQRGLTPSQVLTAIPLIIPSTLPYTIPATTLFATNLVYGRLAHDSEIIAIKAAGINVLTVVWPAVLLGVTTTVGTMGLYYSFIPYTQLALRSQVLADVEEFMYQMLRHERMVNHPGLSYAIWTRHVDGKRLIDATFKRRDLKGEKGPRDEYDMVAQAHEAEIRVDSRNQKVLVHMKNGAVYSVGSSSLGYFDDKVWEVPLPPGYPFTGDRVLKAREMTWPELEARRVNVTADLDEVAAKTAVAISQQSLQQPPPTLAQHLLNLKVKRAALMHELTNLRCEMNMRMAIATGCLCFVLVGCPVGIWFSKSDYLSAFITCFLPIVMLYYPMLLCGLNLARNQRCHPSLGIWACDAIMGLTALWLLKRLARN